MANQQFISPTLAPDLQRRQQENQMRQLYAKQMLEQSQEAPQGQMVSNHYVAPSWSQYLAQGLKSYLGNTEARKSITESADINNQYAQMKREALINALGGSGMDPQMASQYADILGDDKVADKLLGAQVDNSKLTNEQKNLSFLDPQTRDQLLQAPYINEMGKDGIQNQLDPETGQVRAYPVPGYTDTQADQQLATSRAQEQAKAERDLVDVPTGDGGTQLMSKEDAIRALRNGDIASNDRGAVESQIGRTPPDLSNVKETREFQKSLQADVNQGNSTLQLVDRNINYIDRLLDNAKGLEGIVGQAAQFKPAMIMLDKELEANADLDTIKSKVVLQTMEEMRKSSSSGATGFGNMNREQLKVLQDSLGSLDRATTIEQITENLQVIRNTFEQIRNDAIQDFDATINQYGQYLGRDYEPGQWGATREVVKPEDVRNRQAPSVRGGQRPSLDEILGF